MSQRQVRAIELSRMKETRLKEGSLVLSNLAKGKHQKLERGKRVNSKECRTLQSCFTITY